MKDGSEEVSDKGSSDVQIKRTVSNPYDFRQGA